MNSAQRAFLGILGLLLAAYLAFIGAAATDKTGADPGDESAPAEEAARAESNFAAVTDAMHQLTVAGVEIEPYRHGVISSDGAKIKVVRNGTDGFGIFLRPERDIGTLIIPFNAAGDARVVVRTTVSGERAYRNAAAGDFMRITPTTEEVLIFTDEASTIDIVIDGLINCADDWDVLCADSTYLADQIGLRKQTSLAPEEELLKILDWTSNNLVWSTTRKFTSEANELVKNYSAAQMHAAVFTPETSGGFCGASAVFLAKVLNELGYKALTINVGAGPELTHVTTLIYDPFGDGNFYMMDPTFNSVLVDADSGAWVSMEQIISGNTENVRLRSQPLADRRVMTIDGASYLTDCRPAKGRSDAQICFRPDYSFKDYVESFGTAFRDAGLTADEQGYLNLLRYRYYSIGTQAGADLREKYMELLAANGINLER